MIQGRPLYDNTSDAAYFVQPSEWDPVLRSVSRGLNTLIVGGRGVGKTTLLRQLQLHLRDRKKRVEFVDATAAQTPIDFASRIRDALRGRPSSMAAGLSAMSAVAGDPSPPPAGATRRFYDAVTSIGEADEATILVDASGSAETAYEYFGRMRDTLWQFPHQWVVAVDDAERATALKPPADAFFDVVVQLQGFSADQLSALLERRVPDAPRGMRSRISEVSNGNPRTALRALNRSEVDNVDPTAGLVARTDLINRAALLGRPHGMLMAELLDLGQSSPSDEELRHRLGLSRARVTQLLRELLEREMVVTDVERPDGPGRPRTIYRPALPA